MDALLLSETLATIAMERGNGFHRSFDLAKQLVEEWGESGLTDRLYASIPPDYPWEVVADLFSILGWTAIDKGINDNGAAMCRTMERWLLEGDDLRKIRIAMNLDSYPFRDCHEMIKVLTQLAAQRPEVAELCNSVISARNRADKSCGKDSL